MTFSDLVRLRPALAQWELEGVAAARNGWSGWFDWAAKQPPYKRLVGDDPIHAAVAADHLQRVHARALRRRA